MTIKIFIANFLKRLRTEVTLKNHKQRVENSIRYFCPPDMDKRRRRDCVLYSVLIILIFTGLLLWMNHRRQTVQGVIIYKQQASRPVYNRVKRENDELNDYLSSLNLDSRAMKAFITEELEKKRTIDINQLMGYLTDDSTLQRDKETACWRVENELVCLPQAYMMGFHPLWKDVYYRLTSHPDIMQPVAFTDPTLTFYEMVRNYGINIQVKNYFKPGLLLETDAQQAFSCIEEKLSQFTERRSLILAQLIKNLTPNVKLVVIVGDPVEAALYNYIIKGLSKTGHEQTTHQYFNTMINRMKNLTITEGFMAGYDERNLKENLLKWTYIVHLNDYIDVFGKENLYFVKVDDYMDNDKRRRILTDLFNFLNVSRIDEESMKVLVGMEKLSDDDEERKKRLMKMMPETSSMMRTFFQPFNEILAETLNDHRFLWS